MDDNKPTIDINQAAQSAENVVASSESTPERPYQEVQIIREDAPQPVRGKTSLKPNLLVMAALFGVSLLSLAGTFATTSYDTANSLSGIVFYSAVGGAIALAVFLARVVNNGMKNTASRSKALRIILVVIATVSGGVGGLVVAIILAAIASQRACELSSSKCY